MESINSNSIGRASPSHDPAYKVPVDLPNTGSAAINASTLLSSRGGNPNSDRPLKPPAKVFKGELTSLMRKMASTKHLTADEVSLAKSAAENVVNEALASGKGLPTPDVEMVLPGACNIVVQGLPLVQPKRQRCCKAKDLLGGGLPGQPPLLPPPPEEGGSRAVEEGDMDGKMGLPGVLRMQQAGGVSEQEVTCFPSFIIAGTQKSGTTALTGILEKHPWVRMSMRKEVHFFDTKTPSAAVTQVYANNFPRFNASQAAQHKAPFVVGEATPFYLASRNACENMRKLVPDVRLIVLVRDPVKRAYSEYQMKVRRVEEELEIKELLANGDAKVVYDCAVQLFPSNPSNLTKREMYFLENPQAMSSAISECAGRVGQHGKWMDVLFGLLRKLKEKTKSKPNPERLGIALKDLRTNFNRCFVLADVAEMLEHAHPGGAWKARWNKPALKTKKGTDLRGGMHKGGFPGGHPPKHRMPGDISKKRGDAFDDFGPRGFPLHRNLLDTRDARAWNETVTEYHPPGAGEWGDIFEERYNYVEYESGIFDLTGAGSKDGEPFASEYADYAVNGALEVGPDSPLYGDGAPWYSREVEYLGNRVDEPFSDGAAAASEEYWLDHWTNREESLAPGIGAVSSGPWKPSGMESGDGFFSDGLDEKDSGVADGRRLQWDVHRGHSVPSRPELTDQVWGEWGQEGARTFDDTCYMRHEEILPVEKVIRDELRSLSQCFKSALSAIGEDLSSMTRLDAVVAAKALDDHLQTCFHVTPGIANQFIYRSQYGIQAHHCLKYMRREQILFIESDDLRDHPEEVLPRVHDHIGVPAYDYPALRQEDIMAELEKKYPDFEKRTGWRLDSEYKEEMPADLAKEVRDFLKPHMQIFARLVGQSFGDWAIDDKSQEEAMEGGAEGASLLFEEEVARQMARIAAKKKLGIP